MPVVVLITTVAFALPTLILATPRVIVRIRPYQRRRPQELRDVVDRLAVTAVRAGVLLLLLTLALVAAVSSVAALHARVGLPQGVVVAGVGTIVLSVLTLLTFGRPGRR